ncbi:MAG: lipocalin-like domain-containing protein [Deltaproteobacteria bacterium]|nr:MAG: lipocalin-like domain-containing protein [Deltaproteobacteria bacterium]
MKTICRTALAALAAFALAAFVARAGDNQKTTSLDKQLVGAWTLAGNVLDQGGTKSEPFGSGAKGTAMFTSNRRVAVIITRVDMPKFASSNRTTGTPEENKAAVQGSIAYFGTYVEGSTFPNWTGTDQTRTIELSGDELKFTNKNPSMGQGVVTVTWKRVKDARTTAKR